MKRPKTRTRCAHCKRKREPGFMEWCHTRYEWQCSDFETAQQRCGASTSYWRTFAAGQSHRNRHEPRHSRQSFRPACSSLSTSVTVQSTLDENLRVPREDEAIGAVHKS